MKKTAFFFAATVFVYSCGLPKQAIIKNQVAFRNTANAGGFNNTVSSGRYSTLTHATITDKGDYLVISGASDPGVITSVNAVASPPDGWKLENVGKWYFPESKEAPASTKFWYHDERLVFQTLTIPFKIRPHLRGSLKDSFPSVTETGLNLGFAGGYKFSWNRFSTSKNLWGSNTNRLSLTPGIFLSGGAAELKKANTRDPIIQFERKTATISPGLFFVLGFNNINFGYALGNDFATGPGAKGWLYQGKAWHGVIVALDIIK